MSPHQETASSIFRFQVSKAVKKVERGANVNIIAICAFIPETTSTDHITRTCENGLHATKKKKPRLCLMGWLCYLSSSQMMAVTLYFQ